MQLKMCNQTSYNPRENCLAHGIDDEKQRGLIQIRQHNPSPKLLSDKRSREAQKRNTGGEGLDWTGSRLDSPPCLVSRVQQVQMTGGVPPLTPTPRGGRGGASALPPDPPRRRSALPPDPRAPTSACSNPPRGSPLPPNPSRFASAACQKSSEKCASVRGFLRGMGETTHRSRAHLTPPCAVAALDVRCPPPPPPAPARGRRRRQWRNKSPEGRERTLEREAKWEWSRTGTRSARKGGVLSSGSAHEWSTWEANRTCYHCNEKLC
jgi:hypothetical protein